MLGRRMIQPSGRYPAGFTGRLFDVQGLSGVAIRDDGAGPKGLYVGIVPDTGSNTPALVHLTLGDPVGGGACHRTFHVGPSGAWVSVAGWDYAKLECLTSNATAQLCYAWTTEQPSSPAALQYVQTIAPGTTAVAAGAERVIVGTADGGWAWRTAAPGAIVVPAPAAAGQLLQVGGAQYVATVGNTVCWLLAPP